jgi:hypothetical protein
VQGEKKFAIEFSESQWMRIALAVNVMANSAQPLPLPAMGENRVILDRIHAELDLDALADADAEPMP